MNELKQVKYNDQLILTTEQLAEFYEVTPKQIKQNFSNNRDKFEEGKHYYLLQGPRLKEFKNRVENFDLVGKNANQLFLWTRRGAGRHSKMLGTDRAWDMFDELEENYFAPKPQKRPLTATEQLKLAAEGVVELDDRVTKLEEDKALDPGQYNYLSHEIGKAVNTCIMVHHLSLNAKQRALLYKDINHGVNEVTGIRTRSQLRQRHFETACEFVDNWTPSVATQTVIRQLDAEAIADDAMRVAQ